jgi:hypothetical protein
VVSFAPGKKAPSTHWIRGWVGPRAGLYNVKKRKFLTLTRLELRTLGRPARSQSLYRLSYLGSCPCVIKCIKYYNLTFKHVTRVSDVTSVTCLATETRFGLLIGFINNLQGVTTINYNTVAGLHNLQSLHTDLFSLSALIFTDVYHRH